MQFEWDINKELENISKHGVNFSDASQIFKDYFRVERYDDDSSIDEDRYKTIGIFKDVLFVIYTERGDNCRIISARIAEPFERRIYANSKIYPGSWKRVNP